jgi:hypothetical protein
MPSPSIHSHACHEDSRGTLEAALQNALPPEPASPEADDRHQSSGCRAAYNNPRGERTMGSEE